jgi:hypothetical protein
VNPRSAVGGMLTRLADQVTVPTASSDRRRRYLPLFLLVLIVIGGYMLWTAGTTLLVDVVNSTTGTPPGKKVDVGVHGALVVAWIALVAFGLTLVNLVFGWLRREPLLVAVPETLYSWLAGMAAVGMGLLIGISIFT